MDRPSSAAESSASGGGGGGRGSRWGPPHAQQPSGSSSIDDRRPTSAMDSPAATSGWGRMPSRDEEGRGWGSRDGPPSRGMRERSLSRDREVASRGGGGPPPPGRWGRERSPPPHRGGGRPPPGDGYPPRRYDHRDHPRRSPSPPPHGGTPGGYAGRRYEGSYRGRPSGGPDDQPYTPSPRIRDRDHRGGERERGVRPPMPPGSLSRSRDRSPPLRGSGPPPRGPPGSVDRGWGAPRRGASPSPPPPSASHYNSTPRGGGPRPRSPPHEIGIRGSASRAGREGAGAFGSATSSNATPVGGIPTGPRAGGWGARGGPGPGPGGGGGMGAAIRGGGRGGRGGGRGGYFGHAGGPPEDGGPARSLARKVDAGGNAVTPDLMVSPLHEPQQPEAPVVTSVNAGKGASAATPPEAGELEEGEALPEDVEEGETRPATATSTATPAAAAPPPHSNQPQPQPHARRPSKSLHIDSMPSRPQTSFAHGRESSTASSSTNNTPLATPGAASLAGTPGVAAAGMASGHTNPYAAAAAAVTSAAAQPPVAAPTGPASSSAAPTAPAQARASQHVPPIYTIHSFPRSSYPEFDVEIFQMGQARLASLHRLALSDNYATGSTGSSSGLRQAMLDLKEAQMDMEMSGVRREEAERARLELM